MGKPVACSINNNKKVNKDEYVRCARRSARTNCAEGKLGDRFGSCNRDCIVILFRTTAQNMTEREQNMTEREQNMTEREQNMTEREQNMTLDCR